MLFPPNGRLCSGRILNVVRSEFDPNFVTRRWEGEGERERESLHRLQVVDLICAYLTFLDIQDENQLGTTLPLDSPDEFRTPY